MKKIFFATCILCFVIAGKISAQSTAVLPTISARTDEGVDLYNAKKYKDAISELTKAIKENPKDGKAYYYRGMAKMHDGQKGFCKDMEESLDLGYSTSADIFYYGCETHNKK